MRYKHFYGPASLSLRQNEDQALRLWSSTLRRGDAALQYKRYAAAEIYLGAAYEIGIVRLDCADNAIFGAVHILHPAQRLTDLFLLQGNIAGAHSFFNETQRLLQNKSVVLSPAHERVLQELNQALHQALRAQNSPAPAEREVSGLSAAKPVESKIPRRQMHKKAVLSVQGAAQ